jgi:glycosyltransferase involved in cell wall biosynthesis
LLSRSPVGEGTMIFLSFNPPNRMSKSSLKVAVVHDWFNCIAGSEKVVKEIMHCFPDADVFSLVDHLSDEERESLGINSEIKTSFINRLPFQRKFRNYLPLMPMAIEQFDLRGYDVVVSSSHAFAKGALTSSEQIHLTYVHTPIRYAWDMYHEYLEQQGLRRGIKSSIIRSALHYIRMWDRSTADRPDVYMANSAYVAKRIKKTYNRDAQVLYPPCDVHKMQVQHKKDDFFLAAGRLVPYKRFDLVVEAMQKLPDQKLVVIGDGPEMDKIRSKAGPNVELMGYQPDEVMHDYMQRARGFVFAAVEDFGIMPVEAQACGTPVIGINRGGVAETVIDKKTGILFEKQTVDCVAEAMQTMADLPDDFFDADEIRKHAETFSRDVFRERLTQIVQSTCETWNDGIEIATPPCDVLTKDVAKSGVC